MRGKTDDRSNIGLGYTGLVLLLFEIVETSVCLLHCYYSNIIINCIIHSSFWSRRINRSQASGFEVRIYVRFGRVRPRP